MIRRRYFKSFAVIVFVHFALWTTVYVDSAECLKFPSLKQISMIPSKMKRKIVNGYHHVKDKLFHGEKKKYRQRATALPGHMNSYPAPGPQPALYGYKPPNEYGGSAQSKYPISGGSMQGADNYSTQPTQGTRTYNGAASSTGAAPVDWQASCDNGTFASHALAQDNAMDAAKEDQIGRTTATPTNDTINPLFYLPLGNTDGPSSAVTLASPADPLIYISKLAENAAFYNKMWISGIVATCILTVINVTLGVIFMMRMVRRKHRPDTTDGSKMQRIAIDETDDSVEKLKYSSII